jgi:hypothetical protein
VQENSASHSVVCGIRLKNGFFLRKKRNKSKKKLCTPLNGAIKSDGASKAHGGSLLIIAKKGIQQTIID